MADSPIVFSAPMIRALLDGRKTQTRRILKIQPELYEIAGKTCEPHIQQVEGEEWPRIALSTNGGQSGVLTAPKVRFKPSLKLWVREAWRGAACTDHLPPREIQGACCWYEADSNAPEWAGKLRPSIFLPQKLSRLTLIVIGVKVERLQDISRDDAIAEGLCSASSIIEDFWRWPPPFNDGVWLSPVAAYRWLWNQINGADSWNENPWVAAITFRVIKANIDRIEPAP